MPKILLYQFEISPFADKVRRALTLKNLPYETVEVRPSQLGRFKNIAPTGKLPAIDIDGEITVDSSDIIKKLDEIAPDPLLIPADPLQRAQAHLLEDWSDESLYFYDMSIRSKQNNMDRFVDDFARYETGIIRFIMDRMLPGMIRKSVNAQGLGRKDSNTLMRLIRDHFIALETFLEQGEWLVGDAISVADISVASMVTVLKCAQEPAALLPGFTRLSKWHERVDAITLPGMTRTGN